MERYVGKVAIVTGASTGIGAAIAESLTKAGMLVVGLGRRDDQIEKCANILAKSNARGKLYAVKCNLRVEEDILKAFDWIAKNVGPVQVLVNNAAVISKVSLTDGDTDAWRSNLDTNVLACCIATKLAIKVMKANNIEGDIININSICGHQNIYFDNVGLYGASKHAMTNFTDVLRREMVEQKTNIKVSSISPGLVNTDMTTTDTITDKARDTFAASTMLLSKDIADIVVYVLSVPKNVHINEIIVRAINATL